MTKEQVSASSAGRKPDTARSNFKSLQPTADSLPDQQLQPAPLPELTARHIGRLTPPQLLALQRKVGNQAVMRLLGESAPGVRAVQRTPAAHGNGCGCATCAPTVEQDVVSEQGAPVVNRHHDDEQLQAKRGGEAENHGHGCGCAQCTGGHSTAVQRRVEVTSPGDADSRPTPTLDIAYEIPYGAVQRHVAYEHYLLGQVEPKKLSAIAMVREAPLLEAEILRLIQEKKLTDDPEHTRDLVRRLSEARAKRDDVKHTIEQEMDRLEIWMNNMNAVKVGDVAEKGRAKKGEDGK